MTATPTPEDREKANDLVRGRPCCADYPACQTEAFVNAIAQALAATREQGAKRIDRMERAAKKCAEEFKRLGSKNAEALARHEANCYALAAAAIRRGEP